jgi:hypothetical protein
MEQEIRRRTVQPRLLRRWLKKTLASRFCSATMTENAPRSGLLEQNHAPKHPIGRFLL